MTKTIIVLLTLVIAVNTASYGLWAWYNGNRFGAVGVWLWAWAALVAPWVAWLIPALRPDR